MSGDKPAPFDLGGAIGPAVLLELSDPQRLAEVVAAIAEYTGDSRHARAAGQLRAARAWRGGRPACDDSAALASMEGLIEARDVPSVEMAAKIAARTLRGGQSIDADVARLARKYRRQRR